MKYILMAFFLTGLAACSNSTPQNANSTVGCNILGKTANVDFPGVHLAVHYIDEHNLHWKTQTNEGHETIRYATLAPHLHFLNWIETDGLTVSHIVDCQSNTVQSFLSWHDAESPRGARSGILRSGVVSFNE